MLNKLKELVRKNDSLYVIAKCVKNSKNPEMIDLIRGYYNFSYDKANVFIVEHCGNSLPNNIVYDISFGVDQPCIMGFAALLYHTLYYLKFSEIIGAVPKITWDCKTIYYDHQMDSVTNNVFEYYFEPVSEVSKYPLMKYKNVIRSNRKHINIFHNMYEQVYLLYEKDYIILAEQYKRHVKLNDKTQRYITNSISFLSDRTLGVHARGTDYALGLARHPKIITIEEYLNKAKEMFSSGRYDKVFLATEDENILSVFQNEFGTKLVYYTDVFRASGNQGPHSTPNDRPLHYYKLGLEVLRDIYTLAYCDGLIANLSNVSNAARYVNIALGRKYSEIGIMNNGINN